MKDQAKQLLMVLANRLRIANQLEVSLEAITIFNECKSLMNDDQDEAAFNKLKDLETHLDSLGIPPLPES